MRADVEGVILVGNAYAFLFTIADLDPFKGSQGFSDL